MPSHDVAPEGDDLEVAPLARVQRSRLAFAVAVTVAALPLIVLDNLPATAETNEGRVVGQSSAAADSFSSEPSRAVTTAPSTTATEAPTSTAAPETTTTEASTTTGASVVQAARVQAPAPTAPPSTAPPSSGGADPDDPATWDRLAECESASRWTLNSGNGYYGGLQFSLATWQNVGGTGYPHQATKAEQIHRGKILQERAGWDQWPYCSRELGYT